MAKRKRGFFIGDTHFPFVNSSALRKVIKAIKDFSPDYIVQVGDLFDFFSQTRFPRSQKLNPTEEILQGRMCSENMWNAIKKQVSSKCKLYQIKGNHCERPYKRVIEKAPELEWFVQGGMKELYTFKDVQTIHNPRDSLIIDDVCIIHGHYSGIGKHLEYIKGQYNVVHGHTHLGAIKCINFKGGAMWEMDVGFLADINSEALSYTAMKKFSKWTLGYGIVDNDGPRFISI